MHIKRNYYNFILLSAIKIGFLSAGQENTTTYILHMYVCMCMESDAYFMALRAAEMRTKNPFKNVDEID